MKWDNFWYFTHMLICLLYLIAMNLRHRHEEEEQLRLVFSKDCFVVPIFSFQSWRMNRYIQILIWRCFVLLYCTVQSGRWLSVFQNDLLLHLNTLNIRSSRFFSKTLITTHFECLPLQKSQSYMYINLFHCCYWSFTSLQEMYRIHTDNVLKYLSCRRAIKPWRNASV